MLTTFSLWQKGTLPGMLRPQWQTFKGSTRKALTHSFAEVEGKVVGFVYGRESNPPAETLLKWKANKAGFVESPAVAEEHRRKGIAEALLERFFQACRNVGIDIVSLAVPAEEEGARKLYSKLGFEVRGYHLRRRI